MHSFIGGDLFAPVRTFLYGRRMYQTMVFWESVQAGPDVPPYIAQYAADWRAADKVVYSTTLESVTSARTRIERTFDPAAVRALKARSPDDLSVDGPNLAAQAIRAGLVDDYHVFTTSTVVGGGKPFFPPDGVRLALDLVDQRCFDSGMRYAHYRTR